MSGGGIGAEFFVFLAGAFVGECFFGAKMVGEAVFCGRISSWCVSWQGKHQDGGKITWRGNGGEIPCKGPSQLQSLCG